jgi:hypothetical protein
MAAEAGGAAGDGQLPTEEEENMSDTDTTPINAVGDPDSPLHVATLIAAQTRLRMAGAPGPFEYRLHVEQVNDIEAVLVAVRDARPSDAFMAFRNTPVYASGIRGGGCIECLASGARVDILSAWKRDSMGERVRDPRAATMTVETVADLKADAERNRRACMTDVERLAERVAALEARVDAIRPPLPTAWQTTKPE